MGDLLGLEGHQFLRLFALLCPLILTASQIIRHRPKRRVGGIGPLVALLRAPSAAVCGSAAGALQNLSREAAARKEARELGAVVPLGDLLFGTDVQSQVCAAGAILNILGPELGAEVESNKLLLFGSVRFFVRLGTRARRERSRARRTRAAAAPIAVGQLRERGLSGCAV